MKTAATLIVLMGLSAIIGCGSMTFGTAQQQGPKAIVPEDYDLSNPNPPAGGYTGRIQVTHYSEDRPNGDKYIFIEITGNGTYGITQFKPPDVVVIYSAQGQLIIPFEAERSPQVTYNGRHHFGKEMHIGSLRDRPYTWTPLTLYEPQRLIVASGN